MYRQNKRAWSAGVCLQNDRDLEQTAPYTPFYLSVSNSHQTPPVLFLKINCICRCCVGVDARACVFGRIMMRRIIFHNLNFLCFSLPFFLSVSVFVSLRLVCCSDMHNEPHARTQVNVQNGKGNNRRMTSAKRHPSFLLEIREEKTSWRNTKTTPKAMFV